MPLRSWLGVLAACCAGAVIGVLQGLGGWGPWTLFLVSSLVLAIIGGIAFRDVPTRPSSSRDRGRPTAS